MLNDTPTLTKRFNALFSRVSYSKEATQFGIVPACKQSNGLWLRKLKQIVPEEDPDLSSEVALPWGSDEDQMANWICYEVPVLDEHGNQVFRADGSPKMKKAYRQATPEEKAAAEELALRLQKEEEERLELERLEREAEEARLRHEAEMQAKKEQNMALFESNCGGRTASIADCAHFARKIGFAPTMADLREMDEKHDKVDFDVLFDEMFALNTVDTAAELELMFRAADHTGAGSCSRAQFANILTSFGEPMTMAEVNDLCELCGEGDPVDYKNVAQFLLSPDEV